MAPLKPAGDYAPHIPLAFFQISLPVQAKGLPVREIQNHCLLSGFSSDSGGIIHYHNSKNQSHRKNSASTPYEIPAAVAKATTVEEWLEGIPPEPVILSQFIPLLK